MSRPTRQTAAGRAYLDLQNRARRDGRGTQELLTMYVVERWLTRLSRSVHAEDFVLKGGMLLAAFGSRRPTIDADVLARNMSADQQAVAARVAEIAALPDPDGGVEFLTDTLTTATIRDDALYGGVRVILPARIETATVKLRLDINFGDPITPAPQRIELPALMPNVAPIQLLGYPVDTVVAEKLSTAIQLGAASTRVRDWADLYTLTGTHPLRRQRVRRALQATARFRGITLVPLSVSLGRLVALRSSAYDAYRASLGPAGHHLPQRFSDLVDTVIAFADPLNNEADDDQLWNPDQRSWASPTRWLAVSHPWSTGHCPDCPLHLLRSSGSDSGSAGSFSVTSVSPRMTRRVPIAALWR